MFSIKIGVPAVILLGGFLICTTASYGTQEYTKQTKKACKYCHTESFPKAGTEKAKELTPAGKYFQEKKALPPEEKK